MMRRVLAAVPVLVLTATPAGAAAPFPSSIPLPNGYEPEGVATRGSTAFAGSLADGDVVTVELATGELSSLVDNEPSEGRVAVGLAVERGLVIVAGGPTGHAYIYDASTGAEVADLTLTNAESTFVNDVVVAGNSTGELFAVSPDGDSRQIDLGGDSVTAGDGLALRGLELYVVRNQLNQVDVVRLSAGLSTGEVVDSVTSELFDVPTTADFHGNRLVLVNARFGIPDPANAEFDLVQVPRR